MNAFNFTSGFLSRAVFTPYADLDGKAAAEWLLAHGAVNVVHRDVGTNGLASGTINGRQVELSTNGYLSVGE